MIHHSFINNKPFSDKLILKCKNEQHQQLIALSTRSREQNHIRHINYMNESLNKILACGVYSVCIFDILCCLCLKSKNIL